MRKINDNAWRFETDNSHDYTYCKNICHAEDGRILTDMLANLNTSVATLKEAKLHGSGHCYIARATWTLSFYCHLLLMLVPCQAGGAVTRRGLQDAITGCNIVFEGLVCPYSNLYADFAKLFPPGYEMFCVDIKFVVQFRLTFTAVHRIYVAQWATLAVPSFLRM